MKTLAVVNQKGGQAKTTSVFHIGEWAVKNKKRVLYVSLDPQRSLDLLLPSTGGEPGLLSSDLFKSESSKLQPEILDEYRSIIRADKMHYADLDKAILNPAKHLRAFAKDFDLCVIDTPGSLGARVNAALVAADAVLCPVSVGLLEMAGLADLWAFIDAVRKQKLNARLRVMGMLPSKVNSKSPEEKEGLEILRKQFGAAIFPHVLAERAAVKQSITKRRPVWVSTRGAGHLKAAAEWKAACQAILLNLGVLHNG